jgi:hypothetical protein
MRDVAQTQGLFGFWVNRYFPMADILDLEAI